MARRASITCQPRLVGLLVPFGDALLGEHLAQPGMLVMHGPSPFLGSAALVVAGSGWSWGVPPESGTCHMSALVGALSLGTGLYGDRSPLAERA
jgi:hypothetical protein